MNYRRIIAAVLSLCLTLSLLPAAALAEEPPLATITYTTSGSSDPQTAVLQEIGTYGAGDDARPAYLAQLPMGAKITAFEWNLVVASYTVLGLNLKSTTNAASEYLGLATDESNYISSGQFTGTGSTAYEKSFYKNLYLNPGVSLPNTNVTGFAAQAKESRAKAKVIIVQIATTGQAANTDALQTAIQSAPTRESGLYYCENDRYNGNRADTIQDKKGSLWSAYQTVLEHAQSTLDDPNATQALIDSETEKLNAAVSRLISTKYVNATTLYETFQDSGNLVPSDYTAASWAEVQEALDSANTMLDALYDGGGDPSERNVGPNWTPPEVKALAPAPTPEPSEPPEPSATPEPTEAPAPTASPAATAVPQPTGTPEVTPSPEPAATPEITDTAAPSDAPGAPAADAPLPLAAGASMPRLGMADAPALSFEETGEPEEKPAPPPSDETPAPPAAEETSPTPSEEDTPASEKAPAPLALQAEPPADAIRQSDVTAAAEALTEAVDRLVRSGSIPAWQARINNVAAYLPHLIPLVEATVESEYTPESWAALRSALSAAKAAKAPVLTGLFEDAAKVSAYQRAYDALYKAYYWDLTPAAESITVALRVTDPGTIRKNAPYEGQGGYQPEKVQGGYTGEVVLSGDYTLGEALRRLGITDAAYRVFINGVYVSIDYDGEHTADGQDDVWGEGGLGGKLSELKLHPGDQVSVALNMDLLSNNSPTIFPGPATVFQYVDSLRTARFREGDGIEVEAGKPFTLTAEQAAAGLDRTGAAYSPAAGLSLYISSAAQTGTANQPTQDRLSISGKNVVTGPSGQAAATLYHEGWYIISAIDLAKDALGDQPQWGDLTVTKGTYPSANTGAVIRVHVTPSQDLDTVRAALLAELKTVYDAYAEDFFHPEGWAAIEAGYSGGVTAVNAAPGAGAAYDAQQAAILAIKKVQDDTAGENAKYLANFRDLLGRLPDDVSLITESVKKLVDSLVEQYGKMSGYQLRQLTPVELNKYAAIAALQPSLPEARLYSLDLNVEADTPEAKAALEAMLGYLQEHNINKKRATSELGMDVGDPDIRDNEDANKIYQFAGGEAYGLTEAAPDTQISLSHAVSYYAYLEVREAASHTVSGTGWTITDEQFELGDYLGSGMAQYYDVTGGMTVKIGGVPYELKSIGYSGVAESGTTVYSESLLDKTDYKGKDANNVNVRFLGAGFRFVMPYNDVTITMNWGPVSTAGDLTAAKTAAKQAVDEAYGRYDLSKYDAAGKAALAKARTDGLAAIDTAPTLQAVTDARKAALAAMASVAKTDAVQPGGEFGKTVGQVYVSVENTTYPGGDFTGTILSGWYDLCEKDSMMTVALRALEQNGFTWKGTGGSGKNPDYGISYLSSISKGGKTLGEFSGEAGSGWMGTLNDWFVNEGLNMFTVSGNKLENGDEVRIVYTQNLGEDLGGTWGNSNTTLQDLTVSGGKLSPVFDAATQSYVLLIPGASASVTVTPTAFNRNYQVRTYLNRYNDDGAFYKRTESISVRPGDIIYVGCGDRAWPSMNKQGDEARDYTGTKYAVKVMNAGSADSVISMIDALAQITYSNYKAQKSAVETARGAYDGLDAAAKAKVSNYAKLTGAEAQIRFYREIDDVKVLLAAIPDANKLATSDKSKVQAAYNAYSKLTDEQQQYITVADAAKYNAAVEWLKKQGIDTPGSIGGVEKPPETAGGEVTLEPEATLNTKGEATVRVEAKDLDKIVAAAKDGGLTAIIIAPAGAEKAVKVTVELPKASLSAIAKSTGASVILETALGSVELPEKVLASAAAQAKGTSVAVAVEKADEAAVKAAISASGGEAKNIDLTGSVMVNVTVSSGGTNLTRFDGASLSLTFPACEGAEAGRDCKVIVLSGDGVAEVLTGKAVKQSGKVVVKLSIPHLSTFIVTNETVFAMAFTDVGESDWFYDAVRFAVERKLFNGTTDTTFSPNDQMTRAMLVTVLWRMAGEPKSAAASFADVEAGAWYASAVAWASEQGIVTGTGAGFDPDGSITREQLAAMLYRYAVSTGRDVAAAGDLSGFSDAGDLSAWARDAVAWAVGAGLMNGRTETTLAPGGTATRAEVAAILQRFIPDQVGLR